MKLNCINQDSIGTMRWRIWLGTSWTVWNKEKTPTEKRKFVVEQTFCQEEARGLAKAVFHTKQGHWMIWKSEEV